MSASTAPETAALTALTREQRASSALPGLAPADDSSETAHRSDTHSA